MKIWKTFELFGNDDKLEPKLNELQKAGKNIVTVYPSAFGQYGYIKCLTIVYTEEDVEE